VSDDQNKQKLQAIIETVRQMGIGPTTDVKELPPQVLKMLEDYANSTGHGGPGNPDPTDLAGVWEAVSHGVETVNTAKAKPILDNAAKQAAAGQQPVVSSQDAKDLQNAGVSSDQTKGLVVSDTPRWLLETMTQMGFAGDPSVDQKKRIADEWNTVFGTKLTYEQVIQLPQFKDPTETVQKVVQASVMGAEPEVSYSVTLPGNRKFDISGDQQKTQYGLFGYDNKDVVRIVRWADTFDLKDMTGKTAWQPLAALIKAKGLDLTVPDYQDNSGIDPETGKVLHKKPTVNLDLQHTDTHTILSESARIRPDAVAAGQRQLDIQKAAVNKKAAANELSIAFLTQGYKQNLKKYGDPSVAFLASLDQGLADRIMATGGDSSKLSNDDALLAQQYMLNGQWSSDAMAKMGYAGGSGLDAFMQRLAGAGDSGGAIRQRPDPDALRQDVKDFWRKWFRDEPSAKLVDEMAGNLMKAVMSSPKDQQVDVTAQLRKLIEGTGQYQELYGKKQAGQTEEQYQQQFVDAASSMMGNEAPDQGAITAGMKTGQYQTTVGATAASARAWQNSQFLGRLAQAAQIVNDQT
jgi:hypothetical protein